jgi:hypothetical protein
MGLTKHWVYLPFSKHALPFHSVANIPVFYKFLCAHICLAKIVVKFFHENHISLTVPIAFIHKTRIREQYPEPVSIRNFKGVFIHFPPKREKLNAIL